MVDLILRNAVVVTADAERRVIRDGAVAVEGGRIARVGTAEEIGAEARSVVDAGGMLLMPGLINTHCHAADSLFRGLVEDLPLEPWLRKVWKAEAATLDPRTVRLGATLGLAELLLGGVTTVMDMFWHPRETVAAARDLGMRVSTGGIFFDGPGIDGLGPAGRMAQAGAFFDDFADVQGRQDEGRAVQFQRVVAVADDVFRNQAFAYGPTTFGLQFHIELTTAMVGRWTLNIAQREHFPGTQPAEEHFTGRALHDWKTTAFLETFLDRWLATDRRGTAA